MGETRYSVLGQIDRDASESLNNVGTNFKAMPKPGYTFIVVSKQVRKALENEARRRGFKTVNQLLEYWLRVNPRVNPHGNRENPGNSLFSRIDGGPGGIRTHDRQLRRLPRYPGCATGPL